MAREGFEPQFSKLEPITKMTLQVDSSNVFHYANIDIDDK
jgi:hypothetical protein